MTAISLDEYERTQWPLLEETAYLGLAGEVVETIAPHSEADPVAILIQFLAAAGSIMGRRCWYQVESDRHHANLFAVLVGPSSKARKGTSWGRVSATAKVADQQWATDRIKGGLSSGEGFINEVRDEIVKWDAKDKEWTSVDPGVPEEAGRVMPGGRSLLSDRPGTGAGGSERVSFKKGLLSMSWGAGPKCFGRISRTGGGSQTFGHAN